MSEGKSLLPEWWYREFLAELPPRRVLLPATKPIDEEIDDGDGD
jgi:hypothetical protein